MSSQAPVPPIDLDELPDAVFGPETETVSSGNDVFDVNANMKIIIDDVRKNMKPHLVILETYRYREHCGPNFDDHLNYSTFQ